MLWKVSITVGRREAATISKTVQSLWGAGWHGEISLSVEPDALSKQDFAEISRRQSIRITQNSRKMGSWQNFILTLEQALDDPNWDHFLLSQDDVLYSKGLFLYLDQYPMPPSGLVSLYTPAVHETIYGRQTSWWTPPINELRRRAYGGLAYVFRRDVAKDLYRNLPAPQAKSKTDCWVGRYCQDRKMKLWYPPRSFCQHIGHHTAVHGKYEPEFSEYRRASDRWLQDVSHLTS